MQRKSCYWIVLLGLVALSAVQLRTAQGQVRPKAVGNLLHRTESIDGQAKLLGFTAGGEIVFSFEIAGAAESVPLTNLVRWGAWRGVQHNQAVWLSDGSWLCGQISSATPEQVVIQSDWLQPLSIPLSQVRGLVLAPPASLAKWKILYAQMLSASGDQDMLWLDSDKQLSGIARLNSPANGGRSWSVDVDVGQQSVSIDEAELQAMVFSPTLLGALPKHTGLEIGLEDGSLLRAIRLTPDAKNISLHLGNGLVCATLDEPTDFAQAIEYLSGQSWVGQHLSSLEPARYRYISQSLLDWPLGRDRDVRGEMLTASQRLVPHGLAMHADAQVAYRWDGSPSRLLSEVCLSDPQPQANPYLGSVDCEVLLAKKGELVSARKFSLSRYGELQSVQIDIDVSDAQLVVLVVQSASFGQYADQVLWLNARLVSQKIGKE